jgi:glycerol-3-phosphate acyltransferase PlsX
MSTILSKRSLKKFQKKIDYEEYGGAPLLGVQGVVIICHGKSSMRAIANAAKEAERAVARKINEHIVAALAKGIPAGAEE